MHSPMSLASHRCSFVATNEPSISWAWFKVNHSADWRMSPVQYRSVYRLSRVLYCWRKPDAHPVCPTDIGLAMRWMRWRQCSYCYHNAAAADVVAIGYRITCALHQFSSTVWHCQQNVATCQKYYSTKDHYPVMMTRPQRARPRPIPRPQDQ